MNSRKRCHQLLVFGVAAGLPAGGYWYRAVSFGEDPFYARPMNSRKRCHQLLVFGVAAGLPAGGGWGTGFVTGFVVGVKLVCAELTGPEADGFVLGEVS